MVKSATLVLSLLALPLLSVGAAEVPSPAGGTVVDQTAPVDWERWHAGNEVSDLASLQRGARNFMNYCNGCHSLKYMRYQRMADDLKIPTSVLNASLVAPGSNNLDYISSAMPAADAVNWFGKAPPDLSLMVRYKGADYIYRFLKTFYTDPSRQTLTNNLAYPNPAMPDVLSDLRGVQAAVFRNVKDGDQTEQVFDHFEPTSAGNMTPEEFDGFVRDTVNFLDYVSEPAQVERRQMGVWVVLFLLALSGLAWLLKKEYWKDVH